MTPAAFLELVTSLSVQVTLVIGTCAWLVRQTEPHDTGHRLWGTCHVMILTLALAGVLLPHLRLIPHSVLIHRLPLEIVSVSEDWLGRLMLWVLAGGTSLYGAAIAVGIVDLCRIVNAATPLVRCTGRANERRHDSRERPGHDAVLLADAAAGDRAARNRSRLSSR